MDVDIFSIVKKKAKHAGSTDPKEVADDNGILFIELNGSIAGYAAIYDDKVKSVGLNRRLEGFWYMFGGWHELTHVFTDDIRNTGFKNGHCDSQYCTCEVDDLCIPRHEKIANLVAADITVPDEPVLEITGYNNPSMQSYRRLKTYYTQLNKEFENLRDTFNCSTPSPLLKAQAHDLRRKIKGVSEALCEMESEMVHLGTCRTFSEMAAELGVSERILRYKLEAMRLQGMDIDRQELEQYSRMFEGAI